MPVLLAPLSPSYAPSVPARLPAVAWASLAVAIVVGLLPAIRFVPNGEVFDGQRQAELVLLLVLAVGAATKGWGALLWQATPRAARWSLAGVVILGLLSATFTPLPNDAIVEVTHLALLVVGAFVVADGLARLPDAWRTNAVLAPVVMGTALALMAAAIAYAMHLAGTGTPLFPRAGHAFSHQRFLNQVQMWTLPLLALPVLGARHTLGKVAALAILGGWWALLLASGGRGVLLGATVGAFVVACVYGRRIGPWLAVQAAGAGLGTALYFALFAGSQDGIGARFGAGDSDRFRLWGVARDYIQAHPWRGVGPMHYAYRMPLEVSAHPHNQVLQWAAEWGLPAAAMFLAVALWATGAWMRHARATRTASDANITASITAMWAGIGVLALVDGVFVMPVSQLFAVLLGGWTLARFRAHRLDEDASAPASMRGWRFGVGLLAVGLLVTVAPDAVHPNVRHEAYMVCANARPNPQGILHPRFWQAGYLGDWTHTCAP